MRVKILGKWWGFRYVPNLKHHKGDCDGPNVRNKEIRIRSTLKGEDRLNVTIHEILHAADWHRSEEWVTDVAEDMARILTRLGYVQKTDE